MPVIVDSPMPLFDRLAVKGDAQLSGEDALKASIVRDLQRLLNTRSRFTFDEFGTLDDTVLAYGVPDFSERSLQSGADRDAIAAVIRHAITCYEPRLANVSVRVAMSGKRSDTPVFVIGGLMRSGDAVSHVAFELESSDAENAVAHETRHD
jgi:type VI secretion system protein ImpF